VTLRRTRSAHHGNELTEHGRIRPRPSPGSILAPLLIATLSFLRSHSMTTAIVLVAATMAGALLFFDKVIGA
jgi:hypothetical protein